MATPATTITGLISGIDTASIIQQLMTIERRPMDLLQKQVDAANAQKTAFSTINTSLLALKTNMDSLSKTDTWNAKTTSVSDENVLSASATSDTPIGSYTFTVLQMAAASQLGSNGYADRDTTPVGSGSFDLTVGTTTKTITVSATDTLQDVATDINSQGLGTTAVVVNTGQGGSPYKLVLTSKQTGVDNATSIDANSSGLSFTDLSTAKNAILEFGSDSPIQIESAGNTVTGMAPGLSLDLKTLSAAPVTVTVAADYAGVTAKANDFVSKYNAVIDNIDKYTKYDTENNKAAELFGNATLRYLQSDLAMAISTVVDSQPAETNSLTMVGFTLGSDGKLSLDEGVFSTALASYAEGVTGLFSAITDSALASNGGSITGPAADPGFDVNDLINGNTDSDEFGTGNGFQAAAPGAASFTVEFGRTRQISQLILNNINSAAMPSSTFGVRDFSFDLQSPSGVWTTLKSVTNLTGASSYYSLEQTMSAIAMRVNVTATNAGDGKVRLVELSANEEAGVAHRVSNLLDFVTRGGDGQIATEQSSLDSKITSLNTQMENMQARLDSKEAQLRKEFTAMEMAMSKMQSQSQQFAAQMNSASSD